MLYFAYGSNLHIDQMVARCPQAEPVVVATLPGWRLVFKRHADVVRDKRCHVVGALYEITPECERSLDRYEGFPRYYVKEYFTLPDGRAAMFYRMGNGAPHALPTAQYFSTILDGYDHWGLNRKTLRTAIHWSAKKISGNA